MDSPLVLGPIFEHARDATLVIDGAGAVLATNRSARDAYEHHVLVYTMSVELVAFRGDLERLSMARGETHLVDTEGRAREVILHGKSIGSGRCWDPIVTRSEAPRSAANRSGMSSMPQAAKSEGTADALGICQACMGSIPGGMSASQSGSTNTMRRPPLRTNWSIANSVLSLRFLGCTSIRS